MLREICVRLAAGEVCVIILTADAQATLLAECESRVVLATTDELITAAKKSPRKRRGFLACRTIVRLVEQAFARGSSGVASRTMGYDLHVSRSGRPLFTDVHAIKFSISHYKDLSAVAFTARGRIGIDVEGLREFSGMAELAERWLPELGHSRADSDFVAAFFHLWTAKEAAAKALDRGFLDIVYALGISDYAAEAASTITAATATMSACDVTSTSRQRRERTFAVRVLPVGRQIDWLHLPSTEAISSRDYDHVPSSVRVGASLRGELSRLKIYEYLPLDRYAVSIACEESSGSPHVSWL